MIFWTAIGLTPILTGLLWWLSRGLPLLILTVPLLAALGAVTPWRRRKERTALVNALIGLASAGGMLLIDHI